MRTPAPIRRLLLLATLLASAAAPARAQISFTTAIDLALRNSPRVKIAEADAARATAELSVTRSAYIPSLTGGSGLGYAYGFPIGQPTIYNFTLESMIYDQSQRNYIRAARAGLEAANDALAEARVQVEADTAITYIQLDFDLQRLDALNQQQGFTTGLTTITQQRYDAGQDAHIELTRSRVRTAEINVARTHLLSEVATQRRHLSILTGLPIDGLVTVHGSIAAVPAMDSLPAAPTPSAGVRAAYANAQAKQQTAFGDQRKLYRPQIVFAMQYNRYASFNNYQDYYTHFQVNNLSFGVQINWPFYNASLRAKARASTAEALRAHADADRIRDEFIEGESRAQNALPELDANLQLAAINRQLAQEELDVLQVQLQHSVGPANAAQANPKDQQNALIAERQKYLDYLAAAFQLTQAQINVLRTTGRLELWLKAAAGTPDPTPAHAVTAAPSR